MVNLKEITLLPIPKIFLQSDFVGEEEEKLYRILLNELCIVNRYNEYSNIVKVIPYTPVSFINRMMDTDNYIELLCNLKKANLIDNFFVFTYTNTGEEMVNVLFTGSNELFFHMSRIYELAYKMYPRKDF